jgi:hypothetical protein
MVEWLYKKSYTAMPLCTPAAATSKVHNFEVIVVKHTADGLPVVQVSPDCNANAQNKAAASLSDAAMSDRPRSGTLPLNINAFQGILAIQMYTIASVYLIPKLQDYIIGNDKCLFRPLAALALSCDPEFALVIQKYYTSNVGVNPPSNIQHLLRDIVLVAGAYRDQLSELDWYMQLQKDVPQFGRDLYIYNNYDWWKYEILMDTREAVDLFGDLEQSQLLQ